MRELHLQRPRRARRITLVALVDLVIILLIFFMLRTNFLQPRAVDIGAAVPSQAEKPPPTPPLEVEIHRDGTLWLGGHQVSEAELRRDAAQRTHTEKDVATVAVDEGVKLQRAVAVIDVLKSAGYQAVDIKRTRSFTTENAK